MRKFSYTVVRVENPRLTAVDLVSHVANKLPESVVYVEEYGRSDGHVDRPENTGHPTPQLWRPSHP